MTFSTCSFVLMMWPGSGFRNVDQIKSSTRKRSIKSRVDDRVRFARFAISRYLSAMQTYRKIGSTVIIAVSFITFYGLHFVESRVFPSVCLSAISALAGKCNFNDFAYAFTYVWMFGGVCVGDVEVSCIAFRLCK